jgi:O-acetyl-ADP-ribose deacetylase (regulator of RNase III)
MIRYTKGDILQAEAEALVNTVNCVGVMGRGIALQFKHAYPTNFEAYAAACDRGEVQPGHMFVTETGLFSGPRYIINFPTKRHWRGKSRMEDIEAGLDALAREIRQRGIRSIAVPPLGSGLGGLDWIDVKPRIIASLATLPDVDVLIYEPLDAGVEAPTFRAQAAPQMTPGRASLVGLMDRYLAALLDPFITLLEVHKLMYFLQEAGEPLRLRFVKGPYGPYAENLRHVLLAIEGHLIAGYADGGDVPYKQLALVPGAVEEATAFLQSHAETHSRFDRVTQLVNGFETPFGLELLSTVHWVVARDGVQSLGKVAQAVHSWSPGKWQFTDTQIELASERLQAEGWLRITIPTPIP